MRIILIERRAATACFFLASSAVLFTGNEQNHPRLCDALSSSSQSSSLSTPRRSFIKHAGVKVASLTSAAGSAYIFHASSASAATPPLPLPLQTASSKSPVRVEEVGGGFDLQSPPSNALQSPDVFFPASMANTQWKAQRVVTSVEGDLGQAAIAWKSLGGGDERAFTSKLTEAYATRFVAAPDSMQKDAEYAYEGRAVRSAILDRAYEISSRVAGGGRSSIEENIATWDATLNPNMLTYKRSRNNNNDEVELVVVQRKIEPPSESGFGSDELYRIKSSAGGAFSSLNVIRAARVRRRWRRGFDESSGKRIVDGLEITTTYRVLDQIAGTEMPTSTTKSRIRLVEV